MPPPPPSASKSTREPLSIDDVVIDFTGVVASNGGGAAAAASRAIPTLLDITAPPPPPHQQQQQGSDGDGGADPCSGGRCYQGVSDVRAFDPGLQGVMERYAHKATAAGSVGSCLVRRKKAVFGAPQHASVEHQALPPSSAAHSSEPAPQSSLETSQAARDFLVEAQQHQQVSAAALQQRCDAYMTQLRTFCQRGRRAGGGGGGLDDARAEESATVFPGSGISRTNSLLQQLFVDGVPDIEPWDRWTTTMPRYADIRSGDGDGAHFTVSSLAAKIDLVHHPVIPDTHYTQHYEHRDLERPVIQKAYRTKEELRAERRERLRKKQAKAAAAAAAASGAGALQEKASNSSGLAASRLLHDRLSTKNLALNLFGSSVLNPLATDTRVLEQYELRNLEHQRRNHERHVAALPDQILKRARDQRRHATEAPVLRAYRVFPIFSAAHLGRLRNFANDSQLRGFVLYVADCDALVVLAGGEVAARHLDRWILHKMAWAHPDTRAARLCSVPLMDAESLSFHLKAAHGQLHKRAKAAGGGGGSVATKRDDGHDSADGDGATEPVFMNMVPTVEEAEAFLSRLPAPPSPWSDLCGIWRAAFLRDGLQPVAEERCAE
ncbi:hypothetical protein LSCM1_08194 [Leishmania martiniquensis]|uniref:Uncharacterized protein n=1 Tax=Leishmania martiniquensis TaxID=1580590 RepID=A0A836I563_9TRYP|nr:hypothetical protein LSCM1_08194 [Leishmania martiniquensis]